MRLCVALDLPTLSENLALAKELKEYDLWLKVGFRSYIRDGKKIISELKEINSGFKIFLDLKLYDIPNTMADAASEIAKIGVDMFNIHASSGKRAMKSVMERLSEFENRPLVLSVTALTSFSEDEFKEIYSCDILSKAKEFAIQSYESGLDGVVSSALESKAIKENTDENFLTLCPGIRPFKEQNDDQQRVVDIDEAKKLRVDFAVVGRPIYRAKKPKEIVERILSDIEKS